jgi:hypothetical protein
MTTENNKPEEKEITGRITAIFDKGYGFIISPDLKFTRIFFHWTALRQDTLRFDQIKKGMFCNFIAKEITDKEGVKQMRAFKVKIITPVKPVNEDVDTVNDTGE